MSLIPPEKLVYTVLDLKGVLFSLLVEEVSQLIFAFKWVDPVGGYSGQHTWLPQNLKTQNADFWPFYQRFSGKIDYRRAIEGLLQVTDLVLQNVG